MPHTWHDTTANQYIVEHYDFNPHATYVAWRYLNGVIRFENISIHMPHTWHDTEYSKFKGVDLSFQSTCHIRGMTTAPFIWITLADDFNPHATYVAWHQQRDLIANLWEISIHMPHTWHDLSVNGKQRVGLISIHMPHTWHDAAVDLVTVRVQISIHMPHTWHDI